MDRRSLIKSALAGLLSVAAGAEAAARRPFERPLMDLAEPFAELPYEQMRAIRYRPKKLFWGEEDDAWAM